MKDKDTLTPLTTLEQKIVAARKRTQGQTSAHGQTGAAYGMRAGLDLVSGVAVGTGAGVALDRWLETFPLFMLICMGFGVAAGVRLMMETSKRAAEALEKEEAEKGVNRGRRQS